jgi:hypothetical protein
MSNPTRDEIVRALSVTDVHHPDHCDCGQPLCGGTCAVEGEDCYCDTERCDGLEQQVDAVLALLESRTAKPALQTGDVIEQVARATDAPVQQSGDVIEQAARIIYDSDPGFPADPTPWDDAMRQSRESYRKVARALHADGYLRDPDRDREIAAKAWDEGATTALQHLGAEVKWHDPIFERNPYREASDE